MKIKVASDTQLDVRSYDGREQDRALLRRVVQSPLFAKSPRLSDFLTYVCSLAAQGRASEINEQSIGIAVFGRNPDYDPTIDSIVRSHASRLRHRLRAYFDTEGAAEHWVLTMPKGSYVPWIGQRAEQTQEELPPPESLATSLDRGNDTFAQPVQTIAAASPRPGRESASVGRVALGAVGLLAVVAICAWLFVSRVHNAHETHVFSSEMLKASGGTTIVVGSDSALVILQHLTGRPVSLSAYTSHEYLRDLSGAALSPEQVRRFATRRYMPVIDNSIYEKVVKLFQDDGASVSFRYARDLRPEELKQGNAILLGSRESNPWVQLFEPNMNFYFEDNFETGTATMVNRRPEKGEQARYESADTGSDHTVYGLVAYRSNLTRSGHVLILEGLTMAGTQTASDFVLDDSNLSAFLRKIRRPDGSIPHFELLLRSTSVGGESSRVEMVAYRVGTE